MKRFLAWADHRTGVKKLTEEALYENVPGGSRWRYVWGSTLTFALAIQFITGIFLWMGYSPSAQTAWESVFYIQNEMFGGWLLRGIHHFTAQMMTVLLVLHLMQVVIDGAYKAPREVNFWFGLILLILTLALSLTGYLLPWDQKGFWATKVSTNILGITPVVGPLLQKLVIGGNDYGHLTLTRFFALHAGVLPASIVLLVIGHIYLFRRHGITPKQPLRKWDEPFWPEQVLKDAVACLAVLAAVLFLILRPRLMAAGAPMGAELGAPADPSEAFSAARPEWYFLFLFQFLKYFPGQTEIIGALIIPSLLMGVVFLMPFLGQWKLGHRFNIGFLLVMLAGAGMLTYLAKAQDRNDPDYQAAVREASVSAERAQFLASTIGVPSSGALTLLKNDPFTQGPRLFSKNCASCHRYGGSDGMGGIVKDPQSASDLKGFASREWIAGFLDPARISTTNYFGGTKFADSKMAKFVKKEFSNLTPEKKAQLEQVIAALAAEGTDIPSGSAATNQVDTFAEGRRLIASPEMRCTECHQFHKTDEEANGPDLTAWGSHEWIVGMIGDPAHARFYGKRNDRMPAFAKQQILDAREIGLLAEWLRTPAPDPRLRPN
jgi:ubiquinol-cytochrome c reductase cytochrome b subunit